MPAAKRQKRAELDTVTQLQVNRDTNVDAKGMGPRRVRTHRSAWFVHPAVLVQALKCLDMGADWQEKARQDAILDSCARSLPSVKSGLLAYAAFVGTCVSPFARCLAGPPMLADKAFPSTASRFPPCVEWLQIWSTLFRISRCCDLLLRLPLLRAGTQALLPITVDMYELAAC